MSAKTWTVRSLVLAAGISMLAVAAVTQAPAPSPAVAQTATDETLTPTEPMLQELPSVADLADRLLPAVVEITIESGGEAAAPEAAPEAQPDTPPGPGSENPDDPANPFKDFFDEFLKRGQGGQQPQQKMTSMGSGFVVDPSGIIVTNNHVVEGAETIEVHFSDDTVLKAELVGRDPKTDLAVIRVKPEKPLPVVSFGDSDHGKLGRDGTSDRLLPIPSLKDVVKVVAANQAALSAIRPGYPADVKSNQARQTWDKKIADIRRSLASANQSLGNFILPTELSPESIRSVDRYIREIDQAIEAHHAACLNIR